MIKPGPQSFFDFQGQQICDLKVLPDPTDLDQQETLTHLLMEMQPIYSNCERNQNSYLKLISQKLNLPVTVTSDGPTAQEKNYFIQPEMPIGCWPVLQAA